MEKAVHKKPSLHSSAYLIGYAALVFVLMIVAFFGVALAKSVGIAH